MNSVATKLNAVVYLRYRRATWSLRIDILSICREPFDGTDEYVWHMFKL